MNRAGRRKFIGGLLAALAAPAVIRTPGLLMPVSPNALRERVYAVRWFDGCLPLDVHPLEVSERDVVLVFPTPLELFRRFDNGLVRTLTPEWRQLSWPHAYTA